MEGIFKQKARGDFHEYAKAWLRHLQGKFPECTATAELLNQMDAATDDAIDASIAAVCGHLMTPLNPKKVKYAKAIERITKKPAVLYQALLYRDIVACGATQTSDLFQKLRLSEKYAETSEEEKNSHWKMAEKIAQAALECSGEAVPALPTRSEIQENIRSAKKGREQDTDAPSMTRAFQNHLDALCALAGAPALLADADEPAIRSSMQEWGKFCKATTATPSGPVANSALCAQKDPIVLEALRQEFPTLAFATPPTEAAWDHVKQLNGLCTVTDSIPTQMMTRIEDMASRLAEDIVAGRTDMTNMNLSEIGQQVLSGCNEDDMASFAQNIDQLLPALQQMKGSI